MNKKPLILASKSPRRSAILSDLKIPFKVITDNVKENHPHNFSPERIVTDNAMAKAKPVGARIDDGYVIGADTIVVFEKEVLIKPKDYNHAKQTLQKLSGNTHKVYTGIAVYDSQTGKNDTAICSTEVTFEKIDDQYLDIYINAVHPYDKAGGYAIQGLGALVVKSIKGCFFNVMGLPVVTLDNLLRQFGVSLFDYVGD